MSSPDPNALLELGTALADLADFMERQDEKAGAAVAKAVEQAALEISTPIADLMAAIEKNGAETVRALAAALGSLRVEAPPVHVTVQPADVLVQMPERSGWRFKVKYLPNGALDEIDALPRLAP